MLPLLVSSKTVKEGCQRAGLNPKTFYEWKKNPAFKAELERRQDEIAQGTLSELGETINKAFRTLEGLLKSKNEAIKVRAADSLLNYGLRLKELEEVEGRLESIERVILERRIYRES